MVLKQLTTHHAPPTTQRGITLVEMLISMAVTLVMMAAVVNLFANIGTGVRNRRASMELGTQLRSARARLFKDLAGATCPVRPKLPSDDHDDGYFEIIEGQYSDKNPSALVLPNNIDQVDGNNNPIGLQHATSLVPRDNSGRLVQWVDDDGDGIVDDGSERNSVRSTGSALGDYDDILALTVRSESEPFKGRSVVWDGNQWIVQTIESDLAEVIWFAVENPADGTNGEPGMRTVYRRVLLIAPWVLELPPYVRTSPTGEGNNAIPLDRVCYQLSDVSFRQEGNLRVPNTLADLTKRENRFAHARDRYPHIMDTRAIRNNPLTARNNFPEFFPPINGVARRPVFHPFGLPFEWDETESESGGFDEASEIPVTPPGENYNNGNETIGADRQGEDVMLNDVLAFDLRVFDPGAPLMAINNGPVLEPSDAGWNPLANGANPVGYGAFVDLGWDPSFYSGPPGTTPLYVYNYASPTPNEPVPLFKEPHTPGWHDRNPRRPDDPNLHNFTYGFPATYDTWSYHYETDGVDQELNDLDLDEPTYFPNLADDNGLGIDQGTNGLDDIVPHDMDSNPATPPVIPMNGGQPYALLGPDDSMEREAPPPYDHPLRAMQAKIRVYDRESRQIREATVTRNFVPQ